MAEPIKWRKKVILAKMEGTYGTDPTPAGANAMLMTDVSLSPMEGEDVSRELERPYLGAQSQFKVGLRAVFNGSTELVGSGAAGTAPAWGVLARACGLAEVVTPDTSVVYSPVTDDHESVTLYVWIDETLHKIVGCRGTAQMSVNAQGVPVIRWSLTGLFANPTELAQAVPDFTAWQAPKVATTANTPVFTLGGQAFVMRSFELDLGNDVQPRLLIGREEIRIVDRAEQITATVEALPLTTFDPFALAVAQTPQALALTHGTVAGRIVALAAPACELARLTGYENQQDTLEWPLRLTPLPVDGNDQFTLTLT
ncbi:hypothetical protein AUC70_11715 [Methyloceanibacter stevinii]|uniref:Uncharacterized protein n=1 Tax=Methyloceanibacter stevinii TaxID=1774970 RepID=A0A1E3VJ32_9HYPH|nr:phage tail tube protein [Methyloceanibacter stevinii]ODR93525.1 hypothetical protein AUC70_11715 [Methyloceanibacter stevinii]